MKVMRSSYFSRISSATSSLAPSFWRTWDCFAARWHVTLAVAIWPGALNLNSRTLSDGDVGGGHLFPYALLPCLPGTVHGFSRVSSLSRKWCSSHTTSWAAYLPIFSNENIASVPLSWLTGTSSADRPCWSTWMAALRGSTVPTNLRNWREQVWSAQISKGPSC
jgi:hypothetical protein